jgi:phage gp46-like protein
LRRAKTSPETLRLARAYAEEALAWMVTDGIAKRVTVTTSRVRMDVLLMQVAIERADNQRWEGLWEVHLNAL